MLRAIPLAEDYCKRTIRHMAGEQSWSLDMGDMLTWQLPELEFTQASASAYSSKEVPH